jgi:NADP-dependent 3-hydroxy acid dehydrogenase YdfG
VAIRRCDVGNGEEVAGLLSGIKSELPQLRGVFHLAGVLDDGILCELTRERFDRVMASKVLGAWHLHELTRSARLDFFVVYSSVAATLGSPGQAHYAAANRVLDAIAALRRSQGLPATSIAFGPIGDKGYLARRQDVARYVSGAGMQVLPAAAALAALGGVLRRAPMEVAFAEINWSKLAQTFALIASSPRTSGHRRPISSW